MRFSRSVVGSTLLLLSIASAGLARADVAACIDASEKSLALRKNGKLHAALQQLAACADASCPDEVKSECSRRIAEIDAAMPTLILAAKDGSGDDLYDVKVTMDGAPLASSLDGRSMAIDPGEHAFTFEAAGQPPLEKNLVLREGEKDRREVVTIGPVPPTPQPAPTGSTPALAAQAPPEPSFWTTQRTLAVVTGGLGVVGLGLGAWFGGFAVSAQNREKSDCPAAGCSGYAQAQEDYNTAKTDATASTVSLIAGGALAAAGTVLWLTAPAPVRVAPAVGTSAVGLTVVGGF
jgi:hypothetical protein